MSFSFIHTIELAGKNLWFPECTATRGLLASAPDFHFCCKTPIAPYIQFSWTYIVIPAVQVISGTPILIWMQKMALGYGPFGEWEEEVGLLLCFCYRIVESREGWFFSFQFSYYLLDGVFSGLCLFFPDSWIAFQSKFLWLYDFQRLLYFHWYFSEKIYRKAWIGTAIQMSF